MRKTNTSSRSNLTLPGLIATLLFAALPMQANELQDTLFSSAEMSLKEANALDAKLLAPVSFAKGAELYRSAQKRFEKNQSVSRIEKDLAEAKKKFEQAIKAANIAKLSFKTTIKSRDDAISVDAEKLSGKLWEKAEAKFAQATKTLETSSLERAKARAEEAEKLFRDAELVAIKGNYLNQTRAMIDQARKLKVQRYAPKTLESATNLLAAAEKELSENRYDTDYPRSLVKESFYQAKHSIYIAKQLEDLAKKKMSGEDLIIQMEAPIASISGNLDLVAEFDQGMDGPATAINEKITELQNAAYKLGEASNRLQVLEREYALLENRLGIQSERLQIEEAARARLRKVTEYFDRNEAIVLSQGNNVLIRVIGLSFAPGSAQIATENFALLKKLEQAIDVYSDYTVVVEGHTDSFGSDEANQTLSLERARAVRQNFLVHMPNFSASRSEAFGYGEARPIANNETPQGRKRNRRIDLLLKPPAR